MLKNTSSKRKIHDISVLVHPRMMVYPGDPEVGIVLHQAVVAGDTANVSAISMGAHTGTHVDAPCHLRDDWPVLEDVDINAFVGPATVFELDVGDAITARDLVGLKWDGIERVLFKTRSSQFWGDEFREDFVYLSDDAAHFLVENTKVKLVGIDYLSIEKYGTTTLSAHGELLGHGVVIVEGLNLAQVRPGSYELVCLPLRLNTCDGAPARAILIEG